jgi:Arm DNA-binding domain
MLNRSLRPGILRREFVSRRTLWVDILSGRWAGFGIRTHDPPDCGTGRFGGHPVRRRWAFHQMAQKIQRLSALAVSRLSKPGLYADGGGLYLRIGRNGSKSWTFRFTLNGRAREMGLGGLHAVGLADARKKANDARLLLSEKQDPLTQRHIKGMQRAASQKLEAAHSMTFDQCADAYINVHQAGWKNEKHRQQWRNTIATYVSPVFGATPVQDVKTDHVILVIEPIWSKKTETARRLRARIEVILDWAKVGAIGPAKILRGGEGISVIYCRHKQRSGR